MRHRIGLFAVPVLLAAIAATPPWTGNAAPIRSAAPERAGIPVDIELVIAVDISYSMDPEEQALQREGYIKALTSREFLQALRQGMHSKIAVTYFEWAGYTEQRVVVPWRLIEGPESADAFAGEIAAAPYRRAARTSISGAIEFGAQLFEGSGYRGIRHVIDVSGDGANNNGQLVTVARDEAVAKGITINGLPIMLKRLNYATMDIDKLDIYYEDCVIGGPGAFVIAIAERDKFVEATRTKLVLEIAERVPPAQVIPVAAIKPRVSCTIGERLWQERWGN
jgi:Protein of unknown function (DUF1194)